MNKKDGNELQAILLMVMVVAVVLTLWAFIATSIDTSNKRAGYIEARCARITAPLECHDLQ